MQLVNDSLIAHKYKFYTNTIVTSKAYTQILDELPVEANRKMDDMIFGSKDGK